METGRLALDSKPVVTFSGDRAVFSNIEPGLVSGLNTEAVEWKRSYGRHSRQVYVECDFQPWSPESSSDSSNLLGQPVFHTYWTDVMDVDNYRQAVKEDIINWLAMLRRTNVSDWMIVLVETPESRKTNKFPLRTTVLDKLKQDIGGKTPDRFVYNLTVFNVSMAVYYSRCVALMDPSKADSRAAESMQSLLHKFRQFFLQSYNKVLNKFEENIRSQREKRNDPSWNFCQYFLLQEQLAFVYESLGLYDESLIQYDELDALFTQFVLNSNVGDCPDWLEQFNKDLSDWSPLSLEVNTNLVLRGKLEDRCPSLLDMRNYLFSRQCRQLVLNNKTGEVGARAISFLHNTVQELDILEARQVVEGSLDCWVLLACLEVVTICPGGQDTASLWSVARERLLALGSLCGLMPGQAPSSQQLHTVISLTGCLPDCEDKTDHQPPATRLKESLSSNEAFRRNYLEMCEIAISSFKHIGRLRSARLIGRDMATFYIQLGEVSKAASFLVEALKCYQQESWHLLSLQTMLDLAGCYQTMKDEEKLARICVQVASSQAASDKERETYLDQFYQTMERVKQEEPILMAADDIIQFTSCSLETSRDQIIPGDKLSFSVRVVSRLPRTVRCNKLRLALAFTSRDKLEQELEAQTARKPVTRSPSAASNSQAEVSLESLDTSEASGGCPGDVWDQLDMVEQLDYKQDKSLCSARLVCRNSGKVLRRKDSSGSMLRDLSSLHRADYQVCLETNHTSLEPGENTIIMTSEAGGEGNYSLVQLSSNILDMELLQDINASGPLFSVVSSQPVIAINRDSRELFAGLDNTLVLTVETGSRVVEEGTELALLSSRGMKMRTGKEEKYSDKIKVLLPRGEPYQTLSVSVQVKCVLANKKDASTIEHKIDIEDPWNKKYKNVLIHFTPAFYTTFSLLTALEKKFLQIFVYPVGENSFVLDQHKLELCNTPDLSITAINREDDTLVADSNCEAGYLWQLNIPSDLPASAAETPVKLQFSVNFRREKNEPVGDSYEAVFQFDNFLTLYTIQARVEPCKGSEFCRAGTMCPMTIVLEKSSPSDLTNLYYEVLADQAVWAVCGRQGGVVSLAQTRQTILVEVMPLLGGHLALPAVRLSKYIPAETAGCGNARLDPFSPGQVYNMSRSQQVHVLPPNNHQAEFVSLP